MHNQMPHVYCKKNNLPLAMEELGEQYEASPCLDEKLCLPFQLLACCYAGIDDFDDAYGYFIVAQRQVQALQKEYNRKALEILKVYMKLTGSDW